MNKKFKMNDILAMTKAKLRLSKEDRFEYPLWHIFYVKKYSLFEKL